MVHVDHAASAITFDIVQTGENGLFSALTCTSAYGLAWTDGLCGHSHHVPAAAATTAAVAAEATEQRYIGRECAAQGEARGFTEGACHGSDGRGVCKPRRVGAAVACQYHEAVAEVVAFVSFCAGQRLDAF